MKGLYVIVFVGICFALANASIRQRKPVVCSISGAVTEFEECPMGKNCTAGPVNIFIGEQNAEVNFCQKDDSSEEHETDEIQKRLSRSIVRSACKVFNESHTLFERNCTGDNMECLVTITVNIGDQTVAAKYCKNTTTDEFSYLKAFTGQRRGVRPDSGMLRPNCSDEGKQRSNEREERPRGGRNGRRDGRRGDRRLNGSSESDESYESSMDADIEQPAELNDPLAQFRAQRIEANMVSRSSEEDSSDESRSNEDERPTGDIERPEGSGIVGENGDRPVINAAGRSQRGRQDRPIRPRQGKQPARIQLDSASNSESKSNEDASNSDSSEENAVDGPVLEEPVVEFRPELGGGRASRYRFQSRRQE